jgi:hypothetical protein
MDSIAIDMISVALTVRLIHPLVVLQVLNGWKHNPRSLLVDFFFEFFQLFVLFLERNKLLEIICLAHRRWLLVLLLFILRIIF